MNANEKDILLVSIVTSGNDHANNEIATISFGSRRHEDSKPAYPELIIDASPFDSGKLSDLCKWPELDRKVPKPRRYSLRLNAIYSTHSTAM